jgi:aspartokinase/homoserine dehydrogenase 1
MKVLKFGGTSVASAKNIKLVRKIVAQKAKKEQILVVVSAFSGVTNKLEAIVIEAINNRDQALKLISEIRTQHFEATQELLKAKERKATNVTLETIFDEVEKMVDGINIIGEMTPRIKDKILSIGERLSSLIIHQYFNQEFKSQLLNPIELIKTNSNYGSATVKYEQTYQNISKFKLSKKTVAVSPGYIAGNEKNEITTLGRGGSDFSAAIYARGLMADELEIWTDVDGMMTADPRIVKSSKVINSLSYEDAMELSHFGAKVIYPPTIQPVLQKGIPIRIKNTFNPAALGTLITSAVEHNEHTVQGLTSIANVVLVNLKGPGMVGIPSMSQRLFKSFAERSINIILITQASSEHTISIVINANEAVAAAASVKKEFKQEIEQGKIDPLEVEKDLAIVALVGSNMQHQVGVSGKMFSTLGANGVNIKAIAQGSSERNISTVIDEKNLRKALNALHEDFFLSERKRLNLYVVGIGNVGGEFLNQIKNQAPVLKETEFLDLRVVGIANSKKMIFDDEGINLATYTKKLSKGKPMKMDQFIKQMNTLNLRNSIFIDNTATENVPKYYQDILKSSISIVTPNKVAASSAYEVYRDIKKTALRYRGQFLFETNVGAGLPVISTLNDLVKSGDKITAIDAVLSGSLNFIFNHYNGEQPFADIVREAQNQGYTEPDPRIDLSGLDVKRKLLILMREAGVHCELKDIKDKQFISKAAFDAKSVDDFYDVLTSDEDKMQKLFNKSAKKGNRLKFVAQFRNGKASTQLLEIEPDHPFYNLEGKDNIVLYHTRRYSEQPLIVKGAGAGAAVTASGIFADVIKVAHS